MNRRIAMGIDLGGTHLSCALVDIDRLEMIENSQVRSSYDHTASANTIITVWTNTIRSCIEKCPSGEVLLGIGFAMPGPFNYKEGISMMKQKMIDLYNQHIPSLINNRLSSPNPYEMRFINDASCFAIGEAFSGRGKELDRLVVITLGTGFGSAFVDNKLPIVERSDVPKEGCMWHLPFMNDIADHYFSTSWFVNKYAQLTTKEIAGVKELVFEKKADPHTQDIFDEFGSNLGSFIGPYLLDFKSEILIIGGNISKALDHFLPALKERLIQQNVKVRIEPSTLLEDAAILGAAMLFDEDYWKKVSKVLPSI